MKTPHIARMALGVVGAALVATLASACGTSEEDKTPHAVLASEPQPTEPAPAPQPRRLIDGTALPTSPVNLITDPGFGLASEQGGFGSFLAFDEESFQSLEIATTVDSRAPTGFGGAVAIVKADGATNSTSAPVMLLTSFQGGAGPYFAKVWVSKSDTAGKPVDVSIDGKGVRASVVDETPDGEAFDLAPVPASSRVVGGRTWTLLRGEITKPLTFGGFFIVRTGSGGGQIHIAAPEIIAQPLLEGATTRGTSNRPALATRAKTGHERGAIRHYRSKPPRLMPAAFTRRFGN